MGVAADGHLHDHRQTRTAGSISRRILQRKPGCG